jgi:hypothetical protein
MRLMPCHTPHMPAQGYPYTHLHPLLCSVVETALLWTALMTPALAIAPFCIAQRSLNSV